MNTATAPQPPRVSTTPTPPAFHILAREGRFLSNAQRGTFSPRESNGIRFDLSDPEEKQAANTLAAQYGATLFPVKPPRARIVATGRAAPVVKITARYPCGKERFYLLDEGQSSDIVTICGYPTITLDKVEAFQRLGVRLHEVDDPEA